jgi:ribonuclease HII
VEDIDSPRQNLNELTAAAHGQAIAAVAEEGMVGGADAADTDIERYAARVKAAVGFDITLEAMHKADDSDQFVAAASIIAKVERDGIIDDLRDKYGVIGSGYPSDEKTRVFLKNYYAELGEFPGCARTSWKTCEKIRAEVEQGPLSG